MTRRKRRKFTAEFKQEVAELCRRGDRSLVEVAKDLDLSASAVRRWVQQAEVDTGTGPADALSTSEKNELRKLRREVRQLREEKEILKKAAAFFAKESS